MTTHTTLVLDFGFYPQSSELRQQLKPIIKRFDWQQQSIKIENMSDNDWDKLLVDILDAEKCLTI